MQLHALMCSVAMILVVLGIAVAKDTKDSKKKLQIGIKKRVDADKCKIKSRKGDVLSMHYTWYVPSRQKLANPFYLVSMSGEVKYPTPEGKLEDGTEFDSSIPRGEPFVFTLGSGQVIKGWDQGLLGMCEGEKRKLVIPSDMGYGDRGAPPKIPGGATLVFEVELLSIERKDEL